MTLPTPKVGGNASSPLKGFGGALKREQAIYTDGPIARWKAAAKVVPITGGRQTLFDVVVSWLGPPIPGGLPVTRIGTADAQTSYTTNQRELAVAIAKAAMTLLREGEVPLMDDVAETVRTEGAGWRRRYAAVVGDAGKRQAEGF